jgi:hypothetical protein
MRSGTCAPPRSSARRSEHDRETPSAFVSEDGVTYLYFETSRGEQTSRAGDARRVTSRLAGRRRRAGSRAMARSSPVHLGQTEKAKVALREKTASVEDLDAFIRRSRLRAAESVDDTRRALEDVLPPSASRPSLAGHRLRGASATRTSFAGTVQPATPVSASKAPFDHQEPVAVRSPPNATAESSAAAFATPPSVSAPSFISPGASAQSSRSSHRTPARPLPPAEGAFRALSLDSPAAEPMARRKSPNAEQAESARGDETPDASSRRPEKSRWSSPRLATSPRASSSPRADDTARVLAAMASKARARARSVGIGVESSLTVAIDSKNHGGGVAEVSPLEVSPLRTKKDDDDALVAALRGLLKRLTPSGYVNRHSSSRASIKLHRRNEIDELLWKVEHFAAARIQARWRGGEVRLKEVQETRRAVLFGYRATQIKRRDASFSFWRSWSVTRRRLRTRARALSLKHGKRAHYHLGRKTSDCVDDEHVAGGSCDAWTYFEDLGKHGVAKRFRRWRFLAYTFCVWRSRVAFG